MLQEGLYSLLKNSSAVASLVGGRIFPAEAPDDLAEYPCVVYSLVGGSSGQTLDTTGVSRQRLEVNGYSFNSYAEAAKIRAAVAGAIEGWSQLLTDGTNILDSISIGPGTDFVSEQRCFRCMVEFYVLFTQP